MNVDTATTEALSNLFDQFKPDETHRPAVSSGYKFDVYSYLRRYGVEVVKTKQHGGSTLYCLKTCLFNGDHNGNEAAIGQTADGKLFYQCFHDSCKGKTWHDARQMISGSDRIGDAPQSGIQPPSNPAPTESPTPGFKLIHIGDLEAKPPAYLISGLMETDSLALVFGDPGCGKSFFGVDVACCVSTGTDFHGRRIMTPGPVIYVAGEGQSGLIRRFLAWSIRQGVDYKTAPIFISLTPASLCDGDQAKHIVTAISEVAEKHGPPVMIIIDTVARNFGPGDENSTKDMSGFIQAADQLRAQHRASVLLIHHSGHGDKTRARGAMALKGALDAEYRMDKDETGVVRLESTKMKDAEPPEPMAFLIRSVELGVDDIEGNPVTSAVLDDTEYEPKTPKGKQGRGKWQVIGAQALHDLQAEQQQRLNDAGYTHTARVTLEDWRIACANQGMNRQAFYKVKVALVEQGVMKIEGGYVSPT